MKKEFTPNSSFIRKVKFNDNILSISMSNQRTYHLGGVDEKVFRKMQSVADKGESVGKFFNKKLKGKY